MCKLIYEHFRGSHINIIHLVYRAHTIQSSKRVGSMLPSVAGNSQNDCLDE